MNPLSGRMDKTMNQLITPGIKPFESIEDYNQRKVMELRKENAALRARVEALEAENKRVKEAVRMARQKLQATQNNWQEDCLFDCNDLLGIALDVCPSCTWRGDVSLVNGECPYCKTNWHELRKAA